MDRFGFASGFATFDVNNCVARSKSCAVAKSAIWRLSSRRMRFRKPHASRHTERIRPTWEKNRRPTAQ